MNDAVRIELELGSGGSSAVYKAWHMRLRKHVVVKELRHSEENDAQSRRNEVEALKNVKCAYVPQVIDFHAGGGSSCTVMEFVEGESFDKLLGCGWRFTQSQVIKWYGQLASALEAIHRKEVCHRDIKPANIMLTPSGDVCLIDFNAALVKGNETRLLSRSLGYASPEQYEIFQSCMEAGNARVSDINQNNGEPGCDSVEPSALEADFKTELLPADEPPGSASLASRLAPFAKEGWREGQGGIIDWKRSDIYSLGATMYHLLTGKRPQERAEWIVPVAQQGRYCKGIAEVIERSLRIDPSERFASAAELAEAIKSIY